MTGALGENALVLLELLLREGPGCATKYRCFAGGEVVLDSIFLLFEEEAGGESANDSLSDGTDGEGMDWGVGWLDWERD